MCNIYVHGGIGGKGGTLSGLWFNLLLSQKFSHWCEPVVGPWTSP